MHSIAASFFCAVSVAKRKSVVACIVFKLMSSGDVYASFGVYRTGIFNLWACRVGGVTKAVSDCVTIVFKQTIG